MTILNFVSDVLVAHEMAPPAAAYLATSTTSLLIGTGSKTFATQSGLAYKPGQRGRLMSASSTANYMEGLITAYSGTSMTMLVDFVGPTASGTHGDWSIGVAGEKGAGDLLSTNNLSDISNAATARTNLVVPGLNTANTYTISSASALVLGPNGATNPTFKVDTSTASSATGLLVKSAAAGSGVALSVLSSAANENLLISAKGTGHIYVGNGAFTGDDSLILLNRAYAPASGLLNTHAVRDESILTVNVTASLFSGYASFDAAYQVVGTATTPQNHIHGFQARQLWSASGHCSEWAGFTAQPVVNNGAGIIDNAYGFFALEPSIISGGITNYTAFYSNPLVGPTNCFFLFGSGTFGSTANPSVLNGALYVGGRTSPLSSEVMNIQYNGSAHQGLLLADTYASAGTLVGVYFYRNNSVVGSITTSLTGANFVNTSDERLKRFTGRLDPQKAIRIIRDDPAREFDWTVDGSHAIGWGAQTSYSVSPDLAHKPEIDDDPVNHPWLMDKTDRVPYVWAATGYLLDRADTTEHHLIANDNRLDAIEGRLDVIESRMAA
jgi:hypothetical protein